MLNIHIDIINEYLCRVSLLDENSSGGASNVVFNQRTSLIFHGCPFLAMRKG